MTTSCIILGILLRLMGDGSFLQEQRRFERFRTAEHEKLADATALMQSYGLVLSGIEVYLRAFKHEKQLELWARASKGKKFKLIKTYAFCRSSGVLGPKRRDGDRQIPEGLYIIERYNPFSQFYLSLGLNYPNKSDRILGEKGNLGGDIFIHGKCVTIGCIPITDELIKELYLICVYARSGGQKRVPVHIFPARMNANNMTSLLAVTEDKELQEFWKNLQEVYEAFEKTKTVPQVRIDKSGRYSVKGS